MVPCLGWCHILIPVFFKLLVAEDLASKFDTGNDAVKTFTYFCLFEVIFFTSYHGKSPLKPPFAWQCRPCIYVWARSCLGGLGVAAQSSIGVNFTVAHSADLILTLL